MKYAINVIDTRLAQIETELTQQQRGQAEQFMLSSVRSELKRLREILLKAPKRPNFAGLRGV